MEASHPQPQAGLSGQALLNALKALVSRSPAGMCVLDGQLRYHYINQALAEINGLPIEAHIGRSVRELVPEVYHRAKDFFEHAVTSNTSLVDHLVEGETAAQPGVRRAWLQSWYPIVVEDAAPLVAVVVREVTEERRLAHELREAARRKDEFLATLAHELRNPLAPLTNVVELLRHVDDERVQHAHAILKRQTTQLVRLVDDLMDASRIASGKIDLQRAPARLQDILMDAVTNAGAALRSAQHELNIDVPDRSVWVDADAVRLTQVFCNLLNNAAKYTPRTGSITLSARTDGHTVTVEVADTGIGIAPEKLDEIFLMFTQATASATQKIDGLGIGLWLAKTLIEMHDGRLVARSDGYGTGATFTVRLPAVAAPAASLRIVSASGDAPSARRRVLVVDDNLDSAESLQQLLTQNGQDVRVANSGCAALDMAERFRPDIILLDIGLPDMIGWAVAARLRNEAWSESVIIAALTGYGQDQHRELSQEAGIDLHITKPLPLATLTRLLAADGRPAVQAIEAV